MLAVAFAAAVDGQSFSRGPLLWWGEPAQPGAASPPSPDTRNPAQQTLDGAFRFEGATSDDAQPDRQMPDALLFGALPRHDGRTKGVAASSSPRIPTASSV